MSSGHSGRSGMFLRAARQSAALRRLMSKARKALLVRARCSKSIGSRCENIYNHSVISTFTDVKDDMCVLRIGHLEACRAVLLAFLAFLSDRHRTEAFVPSEVSQPKEMSLLSRLRLVVSASSWLGE